MQTTVAVRYLGPLPAGSSRPVLVEADDGGTYVLKLRGAGHGLKALVAEVLAAGIARELGLDVPEAVVVSLDPAIAAGEPDAETREMIGRSAGDNLGIDWLPGSRLYDARDAAGIDAGLASRIVWLDALVGNVDRTKKNPNLLVWHRRLFLFDHGVAFPFHFGGDDPVAAAREPCAALATHLFLPYATRLREAAEHARGQLVPSNIAPLLDEVPGGWLAAAEPLTSAAEYTAYLVERVSRTDAILAELEALRAAHR